MKSVEVALLTTGEVSPAKESSTMAFPKGTVTFQFVMERVQAANLVLALATSDRTCIPISRRGFTIPRTTPESGTVDRQAVRGSRKTSNLTGNELRLEART